MEVTILFDQRISEQSAIQAAPDARARGDGRLPFFNHEPFTLSTRHDVLLMND